MKLKNPLEPFRTDSQLFNQIWKDYAHRPQQERMAQLVDESLAADRILLVEAGTGVGKTLAYLLPLIFHALQNDTRVVVSTETRSLQKQILEKDVPTIEKLLGKKIKAEVCYGASNYVCKRKLTHVLDQGEMGFEMEEHMDDFLDWESDTEAGTRLDYEGFASDAFWRSVTREPDNCLGRKCPNFDESYYFVAKEKWKQANLLIINHSLLASHLSMEGRLLPEFSHLIIDEAHRFPDVFSSSFQSSLNFGEIFRLFKNIGTDADPHVESLEKFHQEFINKINLFPGQHKRLKEGVDLAHGEDFTRRLRQLEDLLSDQIDEMDSGELFGDLEGMEAFTPDEQKLKLTMLKERLSGMNKLFADFLKDPLEGNVHWATRRSKDTKYYYDISIAPIFCGELIREHLLENYRTVVFTSATLSSSGKDAFDYFKTEIGMDQASAAAARAEMADQKEEELDLEEAQLPDVHTRILSEKLDSPFDYPNRSILYLPRNIPDPRQEDEFHAQTAKLIGHLLDLAAGGTFILFTSHKSLKAVHELIKESGEHDHMEIFSQSELGAAFALSSFLKSKNGVLLGLSTFWQGIDIPGDVLRLVVLVRLPFRVPDDPTLEARMEREKSQGKNPFFSIQLPGAVIAMKQGFGRLIRTTSDRGAVCIIDPRVITKGYGRDILNALPRAKQVRKYSDLKRAYLELFAE